MKRVLPFALLLCGIPALAQVAPKDGDLPMPGSAPCPLIAEPVRFCGTSPQFVLTPQADNAEITSYFATPLGIQAIAVVEPIGRTNGLTIERLQDVALQNLAAASGAPVETIPVIQRGQLIIAGGPHPNFVYRGTVDGEMYVYSNSMLLMEDSVAQFVTIESGVTTYSPRHRSLHLQFLDQMQVTQ
ncbi:hypothetical protein [Gymnodinialimonas hymeniacidonis]|uniref:hypothetical protein n=1 Tax=Gymnodinialimonas hymeniacidonis TaxID=3126508 RepID=UPI0034C5DEF6